MDRLMILLKELNGEPIENGLQAESIEFLADWLFFKRSAVDYLGSGNSNLFELLFLLVPKVGQIDNGILNQILDWFLRNWQLLTEKNREVFFEWITGLCEFQLADTATVRPFAEFFFSFFSHFLVSKLLRLISNEHTITASKIRCLEMYSNDLDLNSIYLEKLINFYENYYVWKFFIDNYYLNCYEKSTLKLYKNERFVNSLLKSTKNRNLKSVDEMVFAINSKYQEDLINMTHNNIFETLIRGNETDKKLIFFKTIFLINEVWCKQPDEITTGRIMKAVYCMQYKMGDSIPGITNFLINEVLPNWNLIFCYQEVLNLLEWLEVKRIPSFQEFNAKIINPLYLKFINFYTDDINGNVRNNSNNLINFGDFFRTFQIIIIRFIESNLPNRIDFLNEFFDQISNVIIPQVLIVAKNDYKTLNSMLELYVKILPLQTSDKNVLDKTIPDCLVFYIYFSIHSPLIQNLFHLILKHKKYFSNESIKTIVNLLNGVSNIEYFEDCWPIKLKKTSKMFHAKNHMGLKIVDENIIRNIRNLEV